MGSFRRNDQQFYQTFQKNDPVVGFVGYQGSALGNVNQLGFYRYKCAIEGEDEPPAQDPEPEQDDEEGEDPDPIFEPQNPNKVP